MTVQSSSFPPPDSEDPLDVLQGAPFNCSLCPEPAFRLQLAVGIYEGKPAKQILFYLCPRHATTEQMSKILKDLKSAWTPYGVERVYFLSQNDDFGPETGS